MTIDSGLLVRRLLLGGLALLVLVTMAAPEAAALGPDAPPQITSLAVWRQINTIFVRVGVVVPGGRVPRDVFEVQLYNPMNQLLLLNLERRDLLPDASFLGQTSSFGSFFAMTGPYKFVVTDSQLGFTTLDVTIDPLPTTFLPPPTDLGVDGAIVVVPTGIRILSQGPAPAPTVLFTAVPNAGGHRVTVREGATDAEVVAVDVPGTGGVDDIRQVTLPAGALVPGRRYAIDVEAFDAPGGFRCTAAPGCLRADLRARSIATIDLFTDGPSLVLSAAGAAGDGQTLIVSARLVNPGPTVTVDAVGWLGVPGGGVIPLFSAPGVVLLAGVDSPIFDGTVFSRTFVQGDPLGNYVVGIRLIDPNTGQTMALGTAGFIR